MGNASSVLNDHRNKLNKQGKKLLDECVQSCVDQKLDEQETTRVVEEKVKELLVSNSLPPIRLIRFDDMVTLGTFPRCPDNSDIVHDLDKIDRDNSLLVFISHCWMRGYSGAEGWDGRPDPDSANGEKFALCVKGIKSLKDTFAPRMQDCYVWLDFGCINQDGNPAGELEQLDKIVECCDCIFTPIVDREHASWTYPPYFKNYLAEYQAKLWNDGPHSYLNRGWCRVEMLYAANIPVLGNSSHGDYIERWSSFEAGLRLHCRKNRRPHFLYGTKEFMGDDVAPVLLPPLQHSYLTEYHPLKGNLSVASDLEHIQILMAELQPYLDAIKIKVGYKGQRNAQKKKHGHGTYRYASGDVYEGEWKDGLRHGRGKLRDTSGEEYEGEWEEDEMSGQGTFRYADGEVYKGEWKHSQRNGHGYFKFAGGVYEGEWKNDKRHGQGRLIINGYSDKEEWIEGYSYTGEWKDGKRCGQGTLQGARGDSYIGEWLNDQQHGRGVHKSVSGEVYEGEWQNGKRHGQGTLRYINGDVYEGEWKDDLKHGAGTYQDSEGGVSEGEWRDDKQHGHATYSLHHGAVVYEEEWVDGQRIEK